VQQQAAAQTKVEEPEDDWDLFKKATQGVQKLDNSNIANLNRSKQKSLMHKHWQSVLQRKVQPKVKMQNCQILRLH
jgi:hypothetical protein